MERRSYDIATLKRAVRYALNQTLAYTSYHGHITVTYSDSLDIINGPSMLYVRLSEDIPDFDYAEMSMVNERFWKIPILPESVLKDYYSQLASNVYGKNLRTYYNYYLTHHVNWYLLHGEEDPDGDK